MEQNVSFINTLNIVTLNDQEDRDDDEDEVTNPGDVENFEIEVSLEIMEIKGHELIKDNKEIKILICIFN